MPVLTLPQSQFWWLFWALAIVWSGLQAHAGYRYGVFIYDRDLKTETPHPKIRFWAYGVPHAGLYFLSTLAGFLAWLLAVRFVGHIKDLSELSGGTGTVLVALATFAVLGVSGALAPLMWRGAKII